jgi:hypothetical protein
LPSLADDWNTLTLFGVLVVTMFVALDTLMQRKPCKRRPKPPLAEAVRHDDPG